MTKLSSQNDGLEDVSFTVHSFQNAAAMPTIVDTNIRILGALEKDGSLVIFGSSLLKVLKFKSLGYSVKFQEVQPFVF